MYRSGPGSEVVEDERISMSATNIKRNTMQVYL